MGGALTCLGGSAYRVLMGKGKGRRKLVRPRHRRDGNVKKYVNKVRWVGGGFVNWKCLLQDRAKCQDVMNKVMQLEFP